MKTQHFPHMNVEVRTALANGMKGKPQAIKIRPRQQQDVENRGFHIETLLGDLKSNREIPLKAANPIGYSKENSAFSVVSKAMYPTYGSPAMSGPGLWSDGQSVRTAGYPHQLLVLANCSSQQLFKTRHYMKMFCRESRK